jgi:hypothetical protein
MILENSYYKYGDLIRYRFNFDSIGFFMGYRGNKKEIAWVIWEYRDYEVPELVCTLEKIIK